MLLPTQGRIRWIYGPPERLLRRSEPTYARHHPTAATAYALAPEASEDPFSQGTYRGFFTSELGPEAKGCHY